ncbi:MAG: cobyrinate a,c-diamide synthase [Candidatus Ventricola sp.]
MNRILIAGTGSGCGKTTASLLLMALLREHGLRVAPYKVGPDYIDPGFHRAVCGRPSHNLDTFLMEREDILSLLHADADVAVIEGVMGYYDGLDARTLRCSTWEMARLTRTPVLLVVDASGGAASVAAQVKGFMTLREDSGLAGVLVNRVSGAGHYARVSEAVRLYTGLPCVGYIPKNTRLDFPSRHLGLIPADETPDAVQRIRQAAGALRETVDVPLLLQLMQQAPELPQGRREVARLDRPFRLAVARDEAFSFYYQANLNLLERMGMNLVYFSPLCDAALPVGVDGLYLGGGFPEVFARTLSDNQAMRESVREALEGGLPCYAECGGLLYLSQEIDGVPMVGFLPARCRMTERLQRFGYVQVEDRTGLCFPAHEFHHAAAEPLDGARMAYTVRKAGAPQKTWACGFERKRTLAAFAHAHFLSHPELVRRFWG